MNRVFDITAANQIARLDNDGKGEASFTVTNNAKRPLRGQLRVKPSDSTKTEWLSISGEAERDFSPNATQQVSVRIYVPPGTPPGSYFFRLDAVSVVNPDDDFTEGPLVSMEIKGMKPQKRSFPWWIIAVAAGAVVVLGLAVWALWPRKVGVPPVVGLKLEEARKQLEDAKFKVEIVKRPDATVALGQVLQQEPVGESKVKEGSNVTIYIAERVAAENTVVFEDDFDVTVKGDWSSTTTTKAPSGLTRFLGRFASDTVKLELDNLPPHKTVTVAYDLYIIQTWDGNTGAVGPDNWGMRLDDGPVLINTSFANFNGVAQNFACKQPEVEVSQCPSGPIAGFTGAVKLGSLGYSWPGYTPPAFTDATYKIKRTFNHSKTYLKLAFHAELREGNGTIHNDVSNESWGLDNVRIAVK